MWKVIIVILILVFGILGIFALLHWIYPSDNFVNKLPNPILDSWNIGWWGKLGIIFADVILTSSLIVLCKKLK